MNLNNLTIFNFASEKFDSVPRENLRKSYSTKCEHPSIEVLISLSRHDIQIYDSHSPALRKMILFCFSLSEKGKKL